MEENKYYHDLDSMMAEDREERRKQRRKSRVVASVIAWIVFAVILAGAAFGGYVLFTKVDFGNLINSLDLKTVFGGKAPTETSVSVSKDAPGPVTDISAETGTPAGTAASAGEGEEEIKVDPEDLIPKSQKEPAKFQAAVEAYVASLSVKDKVAGLFIVSPEQITGVDAAILAGEGTRAALEQYAVGGILYSDRNITGAANFKDMLAKTNEFARIPLFLALYEEPGKGVLAGKLQLAETEREGDIADTGDPAVAYRQATTIASYLREYGINLNLGIVADVITNPTNDAAAPSSFGPDADKCASMTAEMAKAYMQWGIASALMCFPGEADSASSTQDGLVTIDRTLDEMKECEFKSFLAGIEAGADMIMVSHVFAPNVTGDNEQCSRSRNLITDILRMEYNLDDVVIITDALNKAAIANYYDSAEAAVASLKAGADMLLLPENFQDAYEGVLDAVTKGVVSLERIDASLTRIFKVKFKGLSAAEVDELTKTVNSDPAAQESGSSEQESGLETQTGASGQ